MARLRYIARGYMIKTRFRIWVPQNSVLLQCWNLDPQPDTVEHVSGVRILDSLVLECRMLSNTLFIRPTLVGGLEHELYFSIQLGIILPTDFHIFQRSWNHQGTWSDTGSPCISGKHHGFLRFSLKPIRWKSVSASTTKIPARFSW